MTPAVCAADGDALPGRRQGSKLYTLSLVRHVGGTKKRAQQCKLALRQRVIKNKICYSNVMKHIVKTKSNQKSGLTNMESFCKSNRRKGHLGRFWKPECSHCPRLSLHWFSKTWSFFDFWTNVIPGHQILKTRMLPVPQTQPALVLKNMVFLDKIRHFRTPISQGLKRSLIGLTARRLKTCYIYLSFSDDAMYLMYECICNNISFVRM